MAIATDSLVAAVDGTSNGTNGNSGSSEKPHLVFCVAAAPGHTFPILQIVTEMVNRGYEASLIAGEQFKEQIARTGVQEHVAMPDILATMDLKSRLNQPVGLPRLVWDMTNLFLPGIPDAMARLGRHLADIRRRRPGRNVIVVTETVYLGALPFMLGAPVPEGYDSFPKTICLNIIPYFGSSVDTAPFGPGLPPDSTPSGRARNELLNQLMNTVVFGGVNAAQAETLKKLGCTNSLDVVFFNLWINHYDVLLQFCPPSLEYPRSDLPSVLRFAGALPPKALPPNFAYPAWWPDLDGKRVIAVTQGTIAVQYEDLVVPTMRALAGRDDVVVVAILGVRGASLPADVEVPANVRVIDYLPYDAVLPRADVFVQNAGYGGFLHSVVHGVPLVVAGVTEDKAEISMRVEWSGIGVNLKTSTPTVEQIREGVEEVLSNGKYKERMLEVRKENDELKPFDVVEEHILAFA